MAAKRSHSDKLLKSKYEVLQELDKRTTQKDLTEKYSIPKNTISTWKKLGQQGKNYFCLISNNRKRETPVACIPSSALKFKNHVSW